MNSHYSLENKIFRRLIFILIFISFFILNLAHSSVHTTLPVKYHTYKEDLYKEMNRLFPEFYVPPYFGALVEHESCISLTHSKCWDPKSRLKTQREEGAGLLQITRAYRADGSLRFDTLTDMVRRYPKELKELNWNNVYTRPDLQIRALLLLWKSNFDMMKNKDIDYWNVIAFSDAAYNGGYGDLKKEMQVCKMKIGCNEKIWFGNVEKTSVKSIKKLYGNRSAVDINRHHVNDVLNNRMNKYIMDWNNLGYYEKYPFGID